MILRQTLLGWLATAAIATLSGCEMDLTATEDAAQQADPALSASLADPAKEATSTGDESDASLLRPPLHCPPGTVFFGDRCVPRGPIMCPLGMAYVGFTCRPLPCPPGTVHIGNYCLIMFPPPPCPANTVRVGNVCRPRPTGPQCPANAIRVGGRCVPTGVIKVRSPPCGCGPENACGITAGGSRVCLSNGQ